MKREILLASRSTCNESEGKEMFSCLSSDGIVECYFPTKSAHDRNAKLFESAPELLEALELVYEAMIHHPTFAQLYKRSDGWQFSPEAKARQAIAKARGGGRL